MLCELLANCASGFSSSLLKSTLGCSLYRIKSAWRANGRNVSEQELQFKSIITQIYRAGRCALVSFVFTQVHVISIFLTAFLNQVTTFKKIYLQEILIDREKMYRW